MNRNDLFKNLGKKFETNRPDDIKNWNQAFSIRRDEKGFYISSKEVKQNVADQYFFDYTEALTYVRANWSNLLDTVFENEVLFGTGRSTADEPTED